MDIGELRERLRELDGRGYKAYKGVEGAYRAPDLELVVDHVQGDPYAEPSRFRVLVGPGEGGFPSWTTASAMRRRATADFLNRRLYEALEAASAEMGSGKSGELRVLRPGQEVLERSALEIDGEGGVVARFRVGLPARGRRIDGPAAAGLLDRALAALREALFYGALDTTELRRHVETVEDAVALRGQLRDHDLVAFVAEGASLPRLSGIDDRPLAGSAPQAPEREEGGVAGVVPFQAPASLAVTLETPNAGPVSGMGVPRGVTLVVGGGYHGKSTLLRSIERGVYDHIPGDGRERVVADPDAVKVRAEDGRRVAGTDISNFIGRLPGCQDTTRFHTENASGSTSQAAAIVEALEMGASTLLLDEDTSATNFMIRDARMQRLIASAHEPITPFIDRARQLYEERGVSTVVVVGGSGDYFDVADTVIAMREYVPGEVTGEAKGIAAELPTSRQSEGGEWAPIRPRVPEAASLDPRRGRKGTAIRVRSRDRVEYGTGTVELAAVEQLVESAQTRAIAHAVAWARTGILDGRHASMRDALESVMDAIHREGLHAVHPYGIGELAAFRSFELAAFLNRIRALETRPEGAP